MFVTSAYAADMATHATNGTADLLMPMLWLAPIVLIFYVLVFRPVEQQRKKHDLVLAGIKKGDQVVTAGGVIGTIQRVDNDEILLEIADNVRVRVVRSTIAGMHGAAAPEKASKFPNKIR